MSYRNKAIIFLAVLSVLRLLYVVYTPFDLSPDEAHYWEWSRRLDLSYYSKGPAVAYVIAFFTAVFGTNDLGVRAGAVLFGAFASYLIYVFGANVFRSERVGFYAAVLPNLTPVFSIGSILMTTDVLFIFFWAAALCTVKKALDQGPAISGGGWWYATGALIGLGFLSKYTMVLMYPCLLLYLIFSKKDRRWLLRPAPYIGGFVSLLLATPVILWNIRNGQVTIKHTMGQVNAGGEAWSILHPLEFIASQAGLLTPLIFVAVVYGVYLCFRRSFKEEGGGHLLVFFTSAPLFFFFVLKGLHGKVQANWAVASYTAAMPAAVWAFSSLYEKAGRQGRRLLGVLLVLGLVIGAGVTIAAYVPWTLEHAGAKKILWGPPYNRVTSWTALGEKVSEVREGLIRDEETFVMSNTYQITSELAFYTKGNPQAFNVNTGSRRMNQYDLWPGLDTVVGQNAVYVKGGNVPNDEVVENAFDTCDKEVFPIFYKGKTLKEFSIFSCVNFKGVQGPAGGLRY